jgi:hypothetical protein
VGGLCLSSPLPLRHATAWYRLRGALKDTRKSTVQAGQAGVVPQTPKVRGQACLGQAGRLERKIDGIQRLREDDIGFLI